MTEANPLPPPASFADVLKESAAEARKVLLPEGTYLCSVKSFNYAKFGKDDTPCVDFYLMPLQDIKVDPDQLAELGIELSDTEIHYRIFITDFGTKTWNLRKLKKFLTEDLKITATTVAETISASVGKQVIVTIVHNEASDGTRIFLKVIRTAKADHLTT
jgi:hypothetical protein